MNHMLHQLLFPFPVTPGSENTIRNPLKIPAMSYSNNLHSCRLTTEVVKSNHKVVNVNNGVLSYFSLLFIKLFLLRYVVMMKSKAISRFNL